MCIKILQDDNIAKYDTKRPLEDQLAGSQEVLIDYDPKDCFAVDQFICEMKRLRDTGVSFVPTIKVQHNNHIHGMQTKKNILKLSKEMGINEVIKLLVTLQHKTDKTLEELSIFCNR
jgi:hypothetical protein